MNYSSPWQGVLVEALRVPHGAGAGAEGPAGPCRLQAVVQEHRAQRGLQRGRGAPVGTGAPQAAGHDGRALCGDEEVEASPEILGTWPRPWGDVGLGGDMEKCGSDQRWL